MLQSVPYDSYSEHSITKDPWAVPNTSLIFKIKRAQNSVFYGLVSGFEPINFKRRNKDGETEEVREEEKKKEKRKERGRKTS